MKQVGIAPNLHPPALPRLGDYHMNQLKTVAQQVEEFGTYIRSYIANGENIDVYKIDTSTHAHICRDKNDNPKSVTFLAGT